MTEKEVNLLIRQGMYEYWNELWKQEDTCRQTKHFFPVLRPVFSNQVVNSNRRDYSALVQVITGHNYMARHQYIIDTKKRNKGLIIGRPPTCTLCKQGEQSSQHILGECGALSQLRFKHFNTYYLTPPFVNLKRYALLGFLKESHIAELQFFMEEEQM